MPRRAIASQTEKIATSVSIQGGTRAFFRPLSRTRWKTLGQNGQNRSWIHRESQSPLPELISFGRPIRRNIVLSALGRWALVVEPLSVLRKEVDGLRLRLT